MNFKNLTYYLSSLLFTELAFSKTCDATKQACLTAPEGLLSGNDKASKTMVLLNWLLISTSLVLCVCFAMVAARKVSDEQYLRALGPGIGACIAGLATFLAYSVVN